MTEQSNKPRRFFGILEEHRTPEGDYIPVLFTDGELTVGVMSGSGPHADPWRWGKTRADALEICYITNRQDFGLTRGESIELFQDWLDLKHRAGQTVSG